MLRGLTTVTYTADDLAAAARWYTELLGVEPYFRRREYVEFRVGDFQHELGILDRQFLGALGRADASTRGPAGAIVYWHVDDLHASYEKLLASGARGHEAPTEHGPGFITASVVDPFGNILGIMYNAHYLEVLGSTRGA